MALQSPSMLLYTSHSQPVVHSSDDPSAPPGYTRDRSGRSDLSLVEPKAELCLQDPTVRLSSNSPGCSNLAVLVRQGSPSPPSATKPRMISIAPEMNPPIQSIGHPAKYEIAAMAITAKPSTMCPAALPTFEDRWVRGRACKRPSMGDMRAHKTSKQMFPSAGIGTLF